MRTYVLHGKTEEVELRAALAPTTSVPDEGVLAWPVDALKAMEMYLSSPILRAVGGLIAQALAGSRIDFLMPDGADDVAYAEARAAWASTAYYWGGVPVSWAEWVTLAIESLEATGNAWAEVAPGMVNLLAPQYAAFAVRDGQVRLRYRPPLGPELDLPPWTGDEERGFVHAAHRSTWSVLYGLPPWISARYSVELDLAHRAYLRDFFQNNATPRYLVHIRPNGDGAAGEQDADMLADRLIDFFRARAGAMSGRNMVVSYPAGLTVEITPMAANGDDPTYQGLARLTLQEILMVRHMSMLHLGITEGGYRATASEQARGLVEYVLRPAGRLVGGMLERAIWPGGGPQIEFAIDDRDSVVALIEAAVKAAGVPVLTPDEARALLGYEPRGDDSLWRPSSMMPEPGGD